MKKPAMLIFCLCVGFSSLCFAEDPTRKCVEKPVVAPNKKASPIFRPFVFLFNKITGKREPIVRRMQNMKCLELSKTEVYADSPENFQTIEVIATPEAEPPEVVVINYTVSGGKIVGNGKNVTWDLSGVKTGTYFIVAGADDGCGVCGRTITMEVKVKEKN